VLQYLVNQQGGTFNHPPGAAARAETAPLAAEGGQPLPAAILTSQSHPQKSVLQSATFEEILALALDIARQRTALGGQDI
jgi:hypothetical protein